MDQVANASTGLFGGPEDFRDKSPTYIKDRLRTHQLYAAALLWTLYLLSLLSIFISLVDGYCLGGGAAGVTWSSLPHAVWQVPNLAVATYALVSLYYDINLDTSMSTTWLLLAIWGIVLCALINVVFLTALAFEVNNDNSTFWLQNAGAWTITVLIGTIVIIILDVWIARKLHVFRMNLGNAHYGAGWVPTPTNSSDYTTLPGGAQDWGEAPPPPPPDTTQSRIGTRFSVTGGPARVGGSIVVHGARGGRAK